MEKYLNEGQRLAAAHKNGPMLVLAGPGSGKTTVILKRVLFLMDECKVHPKNILVVTFSKAAAQEMELRFAQEPGRAFGRQPIFCTFHALCFRILRAAYGYALEQVLREEAKWSLLKQIVKGAGLEVNDEEEFTKNFSREYSKMKNELLNLENFMPKEFPRDAFLTIGRRYEAEKGRLEKLDFDDMLTEAYALLSTDSAKRAEWRGAFQYILVDEFQDINQAQYAMVKLLAEPKNNLFVVGDDDQSIYQFRGARPEFLLRFPKEYPGCAKAVLNTNYRSTEKIVKLSAKLIAHNQNRFEKELCGTGKEGPCTVFFSAENANKEAVAVAQKVQALYDKGILYREMAVIYRTNMQAGYFARAFMNYGIPYDLKDGLLNIYEHWIARDLTAYLLLSGQEEDKESFLRIVNKPKRYISKELLREAAALPGGFFSSLPATGILKKWQREPLAELSSHLVQIRRRKPYEAIKYIRNVVGYDDYLIEYARFLKASAVGLREIADEIMEQAQGLETAEAFFSFIDHLKEEVKRAKQEPRRQDKERVTLSTFHGAKGLEFEAVFLPSVIEGILPHEKSALLEEIEEERRLFYVGITRAKRYLTISEPLYRYDEETRRSRFLKELGLSDRKK